MAYETKPDGRFGFEENLICDFNEVRPVNRRYEETKFYELYVYRRYEWGFDNSKNWVKICIS